MDAVWYGVGTFGTLFASWAVPRATCLILDKSTGAAPQFSVDPPPTPEAQRWAWLQVARMWLLVVAPLVTLSAPLLRRLFPAVAELPVWWQGPLLFGLSSQCTQSLVIWLDSVSLNVLRRLRLTTVHKLLQGPFAWGGRCVQPYELVLQGCDAVLGPAAWSIFVSPLSVYVWWAWLAMIQVLWVLDRSNYNYISPTAPLNVLAEAASAVVPAAGGKESRKKSSTKAAAAAAGQKKGGKKA
mmetsp:Transcript_138474/g.442592  ORF Transcript_138474/g.442592 Transcript_138474/m.442592 type:complete len:240 (+) Transcript_138474:129-848(+)